jgi:hypothetical protein
MEKSRATSLLPEQCQGSLNSSALEAVRRRLSSRRDDYVEFDEDGAPSESRARQQQNCVYISVTNRAQYSDYYDI